MMEERKDAVADADVLRLLWGGDSVAEGMELPAVFGGRIGVKSKGEPNHAREVFAGAEIYVDGILTRGDVVFGECVGRAAEYAVLHVVSAPCEPLLRNDSARIPQAVVQVPDAVARTVSSLRINAGNFDCGAWLADLSPAARVSMFDDLQFERLGRKCADIMKIFDSCEKNWEQTMYMTLFRYMSGNVNNEPYLKLASMATYSMVLRERGSLAVTEALLLGTAGLLDGVYYDDYINQLREHFRYLASKYNITPMKPEEWLRGKSRPSNLPVTRIVQLASFLTSRDFLFDNIVSCRGRADVHKLFSAEASDYWTTHYVPDEKSQRCPKRLTEDKADMLGINVVVPLMFAYANYTGKEHLKEAGLKIMEEIPAETNKYVGGWTGRGVAVRNAMDSQAVIQLCKDYCLPGMCTRCRVGRRIIKQAAVRCASGDMR